MPEEPTTADLVEIGHRAPGDSFVANAMADSEDAPMSEAIVGTATGQLAIASNARS